MADKIAVLIPCYNESKTVAKVIRDMKKALPEAVIYVYDNNSTDGTDEIARKEGAVVRYEHQQGKGNVIRSMFRDIDAQCYLMVDGDDTYPAEFAAEMCSKVLEKGTDMVVGDRLSSTYFTENKRPFHNFGNSIVRGSINRLFKSNIKDIMTGYRAMSYRFVKTFPVLSRNFEIETEMTIHAIDKNMQVENVVIEYRDRPEGSESKLNTYADGFKVLKTIVKMFKNYKPLEFFSLIAAVLFVVAKRGHAINTGKVVRGAPWQIVIFSLGMYLVVYGLRNAGLTDYLSAALNRFAEHGVWGATLGTGFLTAALSSVMNNMPTVLVGALSIDGSSAQGVVKQAMIYANVIGCDLGPKITPIGSLATLLWLHVLAQKNITISWGYYFRVGIVMTLPVLFVTLAALALRLSV